MKLLLAVTPRRLKIALIVVPMTLALVYFLLVAANRFVSESTVTVRMSTQEQSNMPGIAMFLAGVNPPSREDTLYLRHYIHSLEMLRRLDEQLGVRAHFESESLDPLYRLYRGTSQEWFLDYYQSRVEVLFDQEASLLTIRVQGFDPAFAQRLNQAILDECERFVNAFSHRIAREQMNFAETEMKRAAGQLQEAKTKLLNFQSRYKLLDPTAQALASGSLTSELRGHLAKQEAEMKNLLTYLNEDSYQVRSLRGQLDALRSQIEVERKRATSNSSDERLTSLAAEFQNISLEAGFAQDAYKLALNSVENSRIDATRKLKSLVVIQPSSLPETALYPRRVYNLLTLFIILSLIYGIARLVIATIREHQD